MALIAGYFVGGLVAMTWLAVRRKDAVAGMFNSGFSEPLWWIVGLPLWPVWIAVAVADARLPQQDKGDSASAAPDLIGAHGVVVVELRPVGKVQVADKVFDARSDGASLIAGTTVRVVGRSMSDLIVKPLPDERA
ncbi:MAG: NfeD family protein [Opitutaceae bacterium]|nr:NfeD family protein [Opitutaceae bacterium]